MSDIKETGEANYYISKKCFFKNGLTWARKKMEMDCKNYTNLVSCHGTPAAPTANGSCNPY